MAKKEAAKKSTAKVATKEKSLSAEDRVALNDKARYDYGIMNAADMPEKQLKDEMATIDKQFADARKADEVARKESLKSGETPGKSGDHVEQP